MTRKEAQNYFPFDENDDLDELWEGRFFKHKEYFLTRTPIAKTWLSRLRKISKEYNAFLILSNKEIEEQDFSTESSNAKSYPTDFYKAYNHFHQLRNNHKMELFKASDFMGLFKAVDKWLSTEFYNAKYWSHAKSLDENIEVVLSKEAEPVAFLKDLQKSELLIQSSDIKSLKENYNILPEKVKKEVKRLTLLSKI